MARTKKTQSAPPAEAKDEFDVPMPEGIPPLAGTLDHDDDPEPEQPKEPAKVSLLETPEQRRLMRQKRIAKAETEQLRRLTRQFPVIARLVAENRRLKQHLETE
jgi:hypothetical protein